MSNILTAAKSDKLGATAIEYGLLAALVAMLLIASLTLLGGSLSSFFSSLSSNV